jgi:hypothetical protein
MSEEKMKEWNVIEKAIEIMSKENE